MTELFDDPHPLPASGNRMSRRRLLGVSAVTAVAVVTGTDEARANGIGEENRALTLVKDRRARAVVISPDQPAAEIFFAVNDLLNCIEEATTVRLPHITSSLAQRPGGLPANVVPIYVGLAATASDGPLARELTTLDQDGFIISSVDENLVILGASPAGTQFAVSEFLERFVGVRWLMATDIGVDVPATATLVVPRTVIRQAPAFKTRILSPWTGTNLESEHIKWRSRNRVVATGRVQVGHGLARIFPSGTYGATHPEFYPMKNGVRYIPPAGVAVGWQPSFTDPRTVDIAAQWVISVFDAQPGLASISLGVNDGDGYCEAYPTHPAYPAKFNSQGFVALSNIYYDWLNKVAAIVARTYPDKLISCLAYREVADPPDFALHEMIVPFHCRDRYGWVDPQFADREKRRSIAGPLQPNTSPGGTTVTAPRTSRRESLCNRSRTPTPTHHKRTSRMPILSCIRM